MVTKLLRSYLPRLRVGQLRWFFDRLIGRRHYRNKTLSNFGRRKGKLLERVHLRLCLRQILLHRSTRPKRRFVNFQRSSEMIRDKRDLKPCFKLSRPHPEVPDHFLLNKPSRYNCRNANDTPVHYQRNRHNAPQEALLVSETVVDSEIPQVEEGVPIFDLTARACQFQSIQSQKAYSVRKNLSEMMEETIYQLYHQR